MSQRGLNIEHWLGVNLISLAICRPFGRQPTWRVWSCFLVRFAMMHKKVRPSFFCMYIKKESNAFLFSDYQVTVQPTWLSRFVPNINLVVSNFTFSPFHCLYQNANSGFMEQINTTTIDDYPYFFYRKLNPAWKLDASARYVQQPGLRLSSPVNLHG